MNTPIGLVDMASRKIVQNPRPSGRASDSMSRGNSGDDARRSRRTASPTSAPATSTSPACRAGVPTLATEPTQMTATQSTSRRPKGHPRAAVRGGAAPSMRQESAVAMSTSGTIVQNPARQTPSPAKNPPSAGPVMEAAPQAAEITARMRGQRFSGNSACTAP